MTTPDPDRAAAARDFYSRWAPGYDYLARHAPGIRRLRTDLVDTLDPAPGDTVVDVGCGTGATLPYLRERVGPGGTVVGVDFAPGAVSRAHGRVDRAGWKNVIVCRGDATRLPLTDADAVVATFLMGMLPDPTATVREWFDGLDPDRIALLDLARSHRLPGRPLNPLFRLAVRASAPPGTSDHHGESPTHVLDRRVAAAHRAVLDACTTTTHETRAGGFAYLSAGRR
ncbi:class I SAM-dependent methyltransferase [Haloplanus aerogenes]|uniref:Class I SAM-dependent methyltransferase n=1 Tax=Haloplanus aerogenes TaxID=660522 RepID=A0A3M0DPI2_9EURY|nr:class I SAM-dependent methyltransferase [Haloplanus aerogenes]AZH24660.1 class I SAM-dependent methyltransferase [Haloplanus aerogenes]RMB23682.1 methyltransferase family protein [Haloplanus aerogenes]